MDEFAVELAEALRDVRTADKIQIGVITDLVRNVPEEYRPRVVEVVRERIRTAPTVPMNEVLPSFYVLDSIVKVVGGSFVPLFADRLKELFMGAFYRMPDGRTRLCHVLDTWTPVFGSALVSQIREALPSSVAVTPGVAQAATQPPPEKRPRLDSDIERKQLGLHVETLTLLQELEHEIRSQPGPPTPVQQRKLDELRSILAQLDGRPPPAPVMMMIPPPVNPPASYARPAPVQTVQLMPVRPQQGDGGLSVRALDTLYSPAMAGRPCPSCALRFRDDALYKEHLDWHFKQNVQQQGRTRPTQSRSWFLTAAQWHQADKGEGVVVSTPFQAPGDGEAAEPEVREGRRVPADPDNKTCAVCKEAFVTVFDDEEQDWMFEDAVKTESGTVHEDCMRKT